MYNSKRIPSGSASAGAFGGWLGRLKAMARISGLAVAMIGLLSLAGGVSPAAAGGAEPTWTATQASGDVQFRTGGGSWQALHEGQVLGASAEVRTGKDGRAVLTHQTTTMTAAPESHVALPAANRPSGVYRVFQNLGTLMYRVKKRAASMAAFEVETPYMAAVVKGTVFTVNTSTQGASVHLTEGVVETHPTLGGQGATLHVGETARISSKPGADVTIKGGNKRSQAAPGPHKAAKAKAAKVQVTRAADAKLVHVRHPRAVSIFAANNRKGLFAKGVTIENAFKKKDTDGQALGHDNGIGAGNTVVSTVRKNQGAVGVSGLGAGGGAAVSGIASTTNNAGGIGGGASTSNAGGLGGGASAGNAGGLGGGTGGGLGNTGGSNAGGLGGGASPGLSGTAPGLSGTTPGLGVGNAGGNGKGKKA